MDQKLGGGVSLSLFGPNVPWYSFTVASSSPNFGSVLKALMQVSASSVWAGAESQSGVPSEEGGPAVDSELLVEADGS